MELRHEVFRATTFDKSAWGEGPWRDEPDVIRWRWRAFACLMRRSEVSGSWCGYVGVPPTHPHFGANYADAAGEPLSAHGGLTFSGVVGEEEWRPEPDERRELWWFGFDTAHAFDRMPKMEAEFRALGIPTFAERFPGVSSLGRRLIGEYRAADYVAGNVVMLAAQLARSPLSKANASPRRLKKRIRRAERESRKNLVALASRRELVAYGFDHERAFVRLALRRSRMTAGAFAEALGLRRPPVRVPRRLRRYLIEVEEASCESPERVTSAERPEPWSSTSPLSN